jgi:hypothetical protein
VREVFASIPRVLDMPPASGGSEPSRSIVMKTRIALITGAASSAFAVEATQEFKDIASLSTKSRAEVQAELRAAQRDGSYVSQDEASAAPVARSTIQRSQIQAQTREAQRAGLI